jgi:1-deoxy-D-xylulose-5-phosphate reductoisomerase
LKSVVILGSTGSIGTQTLEVIRANPDQFVVTAMSCHKGLDVFLPQVEAFRPRHIAVADATLYLELKSRAALIDTSIQVHAGLEGLQHIASLDEADITLVSIVGNAALLPTLAAIRAGKRVALASKEVLVTSGQRIMDEVRSSGIELLPVDSEHSALFQSLAGNNPKQVEKLILTASGGPFRDGAWTQSRLEKVTFKEALKHPNWTMGSKITIDSSTLMNKGLEVIEARWLFDVDYDHIEVLVHKESIIHSLVQYQDSSVLAQMGLPDMKLPIQYALSYPERLVSDFPRLSLAEMKTLTFEAPDLERFPCLGLAYRAGRMGGSATTVLNAANEALVALFLEGRIGFYDISRKIEALLDGHDVITDPSYETILEIDRETRQRIYKEIGIRQGVSN